MKMNKVEDMQAQAEAFLTEAASIEATLPIMKEIQVRRQRTNSAGETEYYTGTELVEDLAAIAEAEQRIADLNTAAEKLQKAASILSQAIYNTNGLFRRLFELSQRTDRRAALEMQAIKGKISAYISKIEALRDSFDVFTGLTDWSFIDAHNNMGPFDHLRGVSNTPEGRITIMAQAINAGIFSFESNSPASNFPWREVEYILAKSVGNTQYVHLTPDLFPYLATLFTQLDYPSDLAKFLNHLADPVRGPITVFSPDSGKTAFVFCPAKAGGIKRYINRDANGILLAQIVLGSDAPPELQGERLRIMTHAALLSEVVHLTRPTQGIGAIPAETRFVAVSSSRTPITLTRGTPGYTNGLTLTAQTATKSQNRMLAVPEFLVGGGPIEEVVRLSPGLHSEDVPASITNANQEHFVLLHEFDMASHVLQSVIKDITGFATGLVFKGADTVVSTTKDIIKSITGAAGSASSAQAQAMRIQYQFNEAFDATRLGHYHQHFALDAITVTRVGQGLQVYTWASPNTPASLAAFNQAALTNYSFGGDLLNNPTSVFNSYRDMYTGTNGSIRIGGFYRDALHNRQNYHPATFIPELDRLLNQHQQSTPAPNQNQNQQQNNPTPRSTGSDLEFRR